MTRPRLACACHYMTNRDLPLFRSVFFLPTPHRGDAPLEFGVSVARGRIVSISSFDKRSQLYGISDAERRQSAVLASVRMLGQDRANAIFDQIDADKSGEIDPKELMMALLGSGQEHETVSDLWGRSRSMR